MSSSVLIVEEAKSGIILVKVAHANGGRGADADGGQEQPILRKE